MIRAAILDFDGVVLESADIKTRAFERLFEGDPRAVAHHHQHAGVSRYEKFRHIRTEILGLSYTEEDERVLGDRFRELVLEEVLRCPFVPGALELLRRRSGQLPLYVASGTPQDELRDIVRRREIDGHFAGVFGSPDTKDVIARRVLGEIGVEPAEALFVGDAVTDMEAAREVGIPFVGRVAGRGGGPLRPTARRADPGPGCAGRAVGGVHCRAAAGAVTVTVAWQRGLRGAPPGARRWVYCGEDAAWRLRARDGLLAGLEEVATGAARERLARELRGPYLDWIAALGLANDSPEWWSSPLANKNVYAHLFSRIVGVAAASEALEGGTLVVASTPAGAATVAAAAGEHGLAVEGSVGRNRRRAVFMAGWRAGQALARPRVPFNSPGAATTLMATWVDQRSFDAGGAYADPHFGALPEMLEQRGERVAFLARQLPGASGRDTVRRLQASGRTMLFPDAWLSAADRRAARAAAFGFAPRIADDARVGPVPVARLARELVEQERVNHAIAHSYLAVARNLGQAGAAFERVVLPWEGHAWETALTDGVHRHLPGTEVVGYDNVNFSTLALSLYPGFGELGVRPLPDRLVTNGSTFSSVLQRQGFPAERIRVGCALRHAYLHEIEQRPTADGFVLAAGTIDAAQTIELVELAREAFGRDLVVKLHPACNAAAVRSAVVGPMRYEDRPIGELLGEARAMLYSYSVVAYEALAAGVPPVFVPSETYLDLDQLEPFPHLRQVARTPEELREAVARCGALGDDWRRSARAAVAEALAPPGERCVDAFL